MIRVVVILALHLAVAAFGASEPLVVKDAPPALSFAQRAASTGHDAHPGASSPHLAAAEVAAAAAIMNTIVSGGDPIPCSTYTTCGVCADQANCNWCAQSQTCRETTYTGCSCSGTCGAATCFGKVCAANYGECGDYLSCGQCAQDLACGWNVYAQKCVRGDALGACWSSNNAACSGSASAKSMSYWQYGTTAVCPRNNGDCTQYLSCAACAEDYGCGWNVYLQVCAPGNYLGACWSSQDSSCSGSAGSANKTFYWQYGHTAICPKNQGTCAQYKSCARCSQDPACGWNRYKEFCAPGSVHGACLSSQDEGCSGGASTIPLSYWEFGTGAVCPKNELQCSQYQDCLGCGRDPACGWNVQLQVCAAGNANGACWSSLDSKCSGPASSPTMFYWQFGTRSVCPSRHMTCAEFTTCDDCAPQLACGWNGNKCVPGNVNGPCHSSDGGSTWKYSTCHAAV